MRAPLSAMSDEEVQRETRKAKRFLITAFILLLALLVLIAASLVVSRAQRTFSPQKWLNDPHRRTRIVDDLLERYALIGLTEEEITALLGRADDDYGAFLAENRSVYYLGPERGLLSIDSEWLLIDFDGGIVVDYSIKVD